MEIKHAIRLKAEELDLIEALILAGDPDLLSCIERGLGLILSKSQYLRLMDAIGTQLQMHGFNQKWEPTPEGIAIEHLIDRIGPWPS